MPVIHSPPVTQLVTEEPLLLNSAINIIGGKSQKKFLTLCVSNGNALAQTGVIICDIPPESTFAFHLLILVEHS